MQIPQYIDLGKIYEDYVIAYTRVSSADQDIKKQITLAEAYINYHNIDEEKVIWLNTYFCFIFVSSFCKKIYSGIQILWLHK